MFATDKLIDSRAFAFCVQVCVFDFVLEVTVPPALYDDACVYVTTRVPVTFAEDLAAPGVVPLDVAVNTPVDEFTAVNPFCDEASVYDLEYDELPPNEGEVLTSNAVLPLEKVYNAPPLNDGDALVAPAPIFA